MVDQWRRPHESDAEWRLRKEFLTANYGNFSDNRLKCLSSCFVNVECFGCRYPEPVIKLLSELSVGLLEPARHRNKVCAPFTRKLMRFVPAASDDGDLKGNEDVNDQLNATESHISSADCISPSVSSLSSGIGHFALSCPKAAAYLMSANDVQNESAELVAEGVEGMSMLTNSANGSSKACGDDSLDGLFLQFGNVVKELVEKISSQKSNTEILQISLDKCKMKADIKFSTSGLANAMKFACTLVVNNVYVAEGEATSKKSSKHTAYTNAVKTLLQPYLHVEFVDDQLRLVGQAEPLQIGSRFLDYQNGAKKKSNLGIIEFRPSFTNTIRPLTRQTFSSATKTGPGMATTSILRPPLKRRAAGSLSDFVILKSAASSNVNENAGYLSVLQQSACFNKSELKYNHSSVGDRFQCCVTLNGQQIGNATTKCKSSAHVAAARQALCMLCRTCCTVIIKSPQDIEMDDSIKRNEVMDGVMDGKSDETKIPDGKSDETKIPESNVGNMLLKKMGWTGGGIGKGGNEGIEEPVSLTAVINRAGLGSGAHGELAKSINRVFVDYLRSDREDDLVFSPEFSNEERAVIHTEARKHAQQLCTRSYGSKETRYLVLSRRRSPVELVRHIRNNGGETLKYILQEPTG